MRTWRQSLGHEECMKCLRSAMVTHKNAARHTTRQLADMSMAWKTWFTSSKGWWGWYSPIQTMRTQHDTRWGIIASRNPLIYPPRVEPKMLSIIIWKANCHFYDEITIVSFWNQCLNPIPFCHFWPHLVSHENRPILTRKFRASRDTVWPPIETGSHTFSVKWWGRGYHPSTPWHLV